MTEQKIQLDGDEVVFTAEDGRTLTVREVAEWNNAATQWTAPDGVEIPEEAQKLHEQGRDHGMNKRKDEALDCFQRAADLVPQWPHPRHDIAFVHLLSGEWPKALELFEEVARMEPTGFFNTKTAIWALERERDGILPRGVYRAYSQMGWEQDNQRRLQGLQQIVSEAPQFAPAWKDLAAFAQDPGQAQQLLRNGIAAEPDPDTLGAMLSNLALVYVAMGQGDAAMEIVGHLVLDEKATRASRSLASQALLRLHLAKKGITAQPAGPAPGPQPGQAPETPPAG